MVSSIASGESPLHARSLAGLALTVAALHAPGVFGDQGRDIAATCAACHGTDGRSRGGVPALAGRDKAELTKAMREFRDGQRSSTIMQQLARGYTDAEIEAAAAYLAAQK
jgi:cytochrome subunit of sulfide dehydrogenase